MASALTLDTSGLVALINHRDRHHREAVASIVANRGARIIPALVMAEIAYVLEARAGGHLLLEFLQDIQMGAYRLDYGEGDLPRIDELVRRYADLRLGFCDAAVITCAERRGGRVLTTDDRHFPVVARGEGTISILPE